MISGNTIVKLCRRLLRRISVLRSVWRYLELCISFDSIQVRFRRTDLDDLPPLWDISPLYVREMSMNDEFQIGQWLDIINQAFSRNWEERDYAESITNHKIYDVIHTYFLMDGQKYIGVVSEAIFRGNKQVGVTHYLGLDKDYLGLGLGKYLILYTLHKLREHNLASCEGESNLQHKKSLFIHFDFGFQPETKLDYWNTPGRTPALTRAVTNLRFKRVYREWQRSRV